MGRNVSAIIVSLPLSYFSLWFTRSRVRRSKWKLWLQPSSLRSLVLTFPLRNQLDASFIDRTGACQDAAKYYVGSFLVPAWMRQHSLGNPSRLCVFRCFTFHHYQPCRGMRKALICWGEGLKWCPRSIRNVALYLKSFHEDLFEQNLCSSDCLLNVHICYYTP